MRGGLAASKSREKKKRNACTSHFKGSAPPLLFESFASFRNFGQRATSPSPKGANEVRPPWSVRGPKCKLDFSEYALPQSVSLTNGPPPTVKHSEAVARSWLVA